MQRGAEKDRLSLAYSICKFPSQAPPSLKIELRGLDPLEPASPGIWDGRRLRHWRLAMDMTVEEVARRLSVSPKSLYHYEAGRVPPLRVAHRIVSLTRGAILYRDIYFEFHPEYA